VLTPEGRIARYLYGIEYSARDLRLALVEASQNRIGTLVDQVLLFCYHYDAASGKYTARIMNLVRLAGIATVLLICGGMWTLFRRERYALEAQRV
jgi:protein SCO1/2